MGPILVYMRSRFELRSKLPATGHYLSAFPPDQSGTSQQACSIIYQNFPTFYH
jgi:hypothetical protein